METTARNRGSNKGAKRKTHRANPKKKKKRAQCTERKLADLKNGKKGLSTGTSGEIYEKGNGRRRNAIAEKGGLAESAEKEALELGLGQII